MGKPKITRGPWRIEGRRVVALKQKWIAAVPSDNTVSAAVDDANRLAIAAVPDMLAALEFMLRCGICTATVMQMARDAYAKATGAPTP